MHIPTLAPGIPADDATLSLLADAIRCGTVTTKAVLRVGNRYQTWANVNPAPFELRDDNDALLWMEGVGDVALCDVP